MLTGVARSGCQPPPIQAERTTSQDPALGDRRMSYRLFRILCQEDPLVNNSEGAEGVESINKPCGADGTWASLEEKSLTRIDSVTARFICAYL